MFEELKVYSNKWTLINKGGDNVAMFFILTNLAWAGNFIIKRQSVADVDCILEIFKGVAILNILGHCQNK